MPISVLAKVVKAPTYVERVNKVSPALCADLCPGKRGHCGEGIYAGALQVRSAAGWYVQHLHAERHVLGHAVVQEPLQHLTCAVTQRSCIAGRRQVCFKDIQSSSQSSEKWVANLSLVIQNTHKNLTLLIQTTNKNLTLLAPKTNKLYRNIAWTVAMGCVSGARSLTFWRQTVIYTVVAVSRGATV